MNHPPSATMNRSASWASSVPYWEENARWYELWLDHNQYHSPILSLLSSVVEPGERIIDIGGGAGVLALPLAQRGASVTLLEPCSAMRTLFKNRSCHLPATDITVDHRSFQELTNRMLGHFDRIIASNVLHLLPDGFYPSLGRIFAFRPKTTVLVTEWPEEHLAPFSRSFGYYLTSHLSYTTRSSWAYHSLDEASDHHHFRLRSGVPEDRQCFLDRLTETDGHLWLHDRATVHMYIMKRKDNDA